MQPLRNRKQPSVAKPHPWMDPRALGISYYGGEYCPFVLVTPAQNSDAQAARLSSTACAAAMNLEMASSTWCIGFSCVALFPLGALLFPA